MTLANELSAEVACALLAPQDPAGGADRGRALRALDELYAVLRGLEREARRRRLGRLPSEPQAAAAAGVG